MKKTNIKYKNFNSQPKAYEVKISDPVLYMMNYTTNLVSFLESIYLEMTMKQTTDKRQQTTEKNE